MIKKLIKLLLIILWMGLIFSFSNDSGVVSTKKSDGFIIRTVETILGRDLSDDEKEKWTTYLVVPVRKGAHVGVYFILGLLVVSFINEFYLFNYKTILIAGGVCLLYACSDEIHQLLVPGRSGQVKDVLLDFLGSLLAIISYYFIGKRVYDKK